MLSLTGKQIRAQFEKSRLGLSLIREQSRAQFERRGDYGTVWSESRLGISLTGKQIRAQFERRGDYGSVLSERRLRLSLNGEQIRAQFEKSRLGLRLIREQIRTQLFSLVGDLIRPIPKGLKIYTQVLDKQF